MRSDASTEAPTEAPTSSPTGGLQAIHGDTRWGDHYVPRVGLAAVESFKTRGDRVAQVRSRQRSNLDGIELSVNWFESAVPRL